MLEKLYNLLCEKAINDGSPLAYDVKIVLDKFFESNICIPKGTNRHPYADVLHEWIEDITKDLQYYNHDSSIRGYLSIPNFYKYRIKPPEPVYEYFAVDDNGIIDWMTMDEFAINNDFKFIAKKTKRERK